MYLHDYRWSAGFTNQELNVVRKALNFASFEDAEALDEKEVVIAENLARIIGGVYAAKRAEREQRQGQGDDHRISDHQHQPPGRALSHQPQG